MPDESGSRRKFDLQIEVSRLEQKDDDKKQSVCITYRALCQLRPLSCLQSLPHFIMLKMMKTKTRRNQNLPSYPGSRWHLRSGFTQPDADRGPWCGPGAGCLLPGVPSPVSIPRLPSCPMGSKTPLKPGDFPLPIKSHPLKVGVCLNLMFPNG